MSCMMMNDKPLAAVADALEGVLHMGYDFFGFSAPESLHNEITALRQEAGYGCNPDYDSRLLLRKLYAVNAAAWNGRYCRDEDPINPNDAPDINPADYRIYKRREYTDQPPVHITVQPWHYHLAKLLEFWLYQTCEDATLKDPFRLAVEEFRDDLFSFIVTRSSLYDSAPGWGRL